jgi:N-acetylglutamate synthase-like GNAT family acetyltransferase
VDLVDFPALPYVLYHTQQFMGPFVDRIGFSIRKANESDAPGILACLRAAFEEYRSSYTPAAFLDTVCTPETIGQRLKDMYVFVATDEWGQIIGTIACNVVDQDEGHIRGMAVLPAWHGAGVATHLLRRAESQLREQSCKRVSLDTTQPLKRAIRFYEKNDFRPSDRIKDFFGMPLFEYVKTLA